MALFKYTDKGFLREHPFGDPYLEPSPVQSHSYIFPGDEILFYHKISLPNDVDVADISRVNLLSAKLSVLAVKPQVFSEEFNNVFKSTRIFELDSFSVAFNNLNAPRLPYGTNGADGYAQSLQVEQDRIFKLPSGDLRREIKMFTTHTNGTTDWDYWFYFPVLFRWEYWLPLLGADNDFFNTAEAQNGKNHWWYHYFVLNRWKLVSRLELKCTVDGVPTTVRNNFSFATATRDVNDYQSSSLWFNESIKTSSIGNTPTNNPCLIKSNEDTTVQAEFTKFSAWSPGEKAEISGVLWIEPYLGTGVASRTRGSTLYPVGSESVFKGLGTALTDDNGINIVTDNGDYIIVSTGGPGVIMYFDQANDRIVRFFGIINHEKLARIYPGVTKFMLYARLYNSMLVDGETKRGEEVRQLAQLISLPAGFDDCNRKEPLCPFTLDVLADEVDDDEMKNDTTSFLLYGDASISSIEMVLQKGTDCDGWEDVTDLNDQSYGQFFAYGYKNDFLGDTFEDDYGKKYTGIILSWRSILSEFGVGKYRLKYKKIDVLLNETTYYDVNVYCLKHYHCNFANKTIRIDVLNQGLRGSLLDPNVQIDYGQGWRSSYRLKGVLKYKGSGYRTEFNQYNDSRFNAQLPVINEQTPRYTLALRPISGDMDFIVSTNILQADEILVTDFNINNRHNFYKVPVIIDGEYTPRDNNLRNPLSDVEIPLAYARNNLRRRNS